MRITLREFLHEYTLFRVPTRKKPAGWLRQALYVSTLALQRRPSHLFDGGENVVRGNHPHDHASLIRHRAGGARPCPSS